MPPFVICSVPALYPTKPRRTGMEPLSTTREFRMIEPVVLPVTTRLRSAAVKVRLPPAVRRPLSTVAPKVVLNAPPFTTCPAVRLKTSVSLVNVNVEAAVGFKAIALTANPPAGIVIAVAVSL